MIEHVTFLSSFGGPVGFLMHIGWNHYSFFHSRTSQGKLNRSEQVRTPDFCETRSKPSLLPSEAAAQPTDHLCWKNLSIFFFFILRMWAKILIIYPYCSCWPCRQIQLLQISGMPAVLNHFKTITFAKQTAEIRVKHPTTTRLTAATQSLSLFSCSLSVLNCASFGLFLTSYCLRGIRKVDKLVQ